MNKKVALVILDGWGHGDKTESDAIYNAQTPFMDSLYEKYPHSTLVTSGEEVGLPEGQMGNSEVGHLNIGAGRVVYQDLVKINLAVKDGSFFENPVLSTALNYAKENGKKVHYLGLVSEGRVHSSQAHLHALCDMAKQYGVNDVFVHAFTDGRDVDPKSGKGYMEELQSHLKTSNGTVASVTGRYYAMDRDKRWERVAKAYNVMVKGTGTKFQDPIEAIQASYDSGVTDEFIEPVSIVDENNVPVGLIEQGDVVICFNFRTDRCREITQALSQQEFPEEGMKTIPLHYVTMTKYDETFKNVNIAYEKDNLTNTMGEVLESAGKTQIRIAETEKYPHVTFFFSGGREEEFVGEKRLIAASPKVATYDLQPEMSAPEVTDKITAELEKGEVDFVCLNFANPDMVGHTGVYDAVVKAVETVDSCLKRVVETGLEKGYSYIIIADHGNADFVINPDGSPHTAHTTNPVPCILIDDDYKSINPGKLGDLAPTILKMMEVEIPSDMTGDVLV
ncbi:MAG: phosphoglycerate mutase (2,3-diphosphoglycerate-independent) [Flavobacteriales bacterium]|nr:phosphoglycerate mutase (2,3-diphosphoglycerate-independent) [Flavobacteriales bacterium]MBO72342.1 phosphoglycerate mutase (2,3-diphosphoglycerate-independent) [Flavobacteriales bacterium]